LPRIPVTRLVSVEYRRVDTTYRISGLDLGRSSEEFAGLKYGELRIHSNGISILTVRGPKRTCEDRELRGHTTAYEETEKLELLLRRFVRDICGRFAITEDAIEDGKRKCCITRGILDDLIDSRTKRTVFLGSKHHIQSWEWRLI
jgi:hypothetical protein